MEATPRRGFLSIVAGAALAVAGAALAVPTVLYLLFPWGRRTVETGDDFLPVGPLASFPLGRFKRVEVVSHRRDAWTLTPKVAVGAVWVRREEGEVRVVSTVCPHLACDVEWKGDRFECPCHESTYAPDGARLSGPARRGLDPLEYRVRDGVLEVRYVRFKPDTAQRTPA